LHSRLREQSAWVTSNVPCAYLAKNITSGELDAKFTREVVKFEKEYFGRGPLDTRTFFIDDMIVERLRGVLTRAEEKISESGESQALVKDARRQLFESSHKILEDLIEENID